MNEITVLAFFDEIVKIKEAGILRDVGMRILTKAKALPGAAAGAIDNAGKAVSSFSTPVDSLKRGWRMTTQDFGNMSGGQKGLLALGLMGSGHEALAKEDPLGQGRGRVERISTAVGDQLGGIIGTPFGITGGIVAGQIGRKAGSIVGKGLTAVGRSLKKPQPASTL